MLPLTAKHILFIRNEMQVSVKALYLQVDNHFSVTSQLRIHIDKNRHFIRCHRVQTEPTSGVGWLNSMQEKSFLGRW